MKCALDECYSEYYARILWRYYGDFIMLKTECSFRPGRQIWDQADNGFHHSFWFEKMNSRWIKGRILTFVCTEIFNKVSQFTSVTEVQFHVLFLIESYFILYWTKALFAASMRNYGFWPWEWISSICITAFWSDWMLFSAAK